ncbi:hypothetical protein PCL_01920 [Purpureocillium lilacinum]|uniref:Uncharacterized protein n=1 Tax=Purpureocillium lilacinum TaxID=33203 RepID=A0A2U3DNY8_PURLI|nr:hypothetical protein PCL_01920 [Purpureocillium lilacinum]
MWVGRATLTLRLYKLAEHVLSRHSTSNEASDDHVIRFDVALGQEDLKERFLLLLAPLKSLELGSKFPFSFALSGRSGGHPDLGSFPAAKSTGRTHLLSARHEILVIRNLLGGERSKEDEVGQEGIDGRKCERFSATVTRKEKSRY